MLNSRKKFRDKKYKYSNSCGVRKFFFERNKKPFKLNGRSLRLYLQYVSYAYYTTVKYRASVIHFIKISETFHKMFK
jgi:hypothetical protein